ncbi:CATRA conflict system CASPASE/TPR repeat-associated protein [Nocardia thailandica]
MSRTFHDQELIGHLFAPADGPRAATACAQLQAFWAAARRQLEIDVAIPATGVPGDLPADVFGRDDRTLAVAENRTTDYQLVARRRGGVVAVSLVFAAPEDGAERRRRIGSPVPADWHQFHRWWQQLCLGGVDAMLGTALVFQAKVDTDVGAADLREALPISGHWSAPQVVDASARLAVRELDAPGRAERVVFVEARRGRENELSDWTWSDGSVAMPPLARYLMHAAELRYQDEVLGNGDGVQAQVEQARRDLAALVEGWAAHDHRGGRADIARALIRDQSVLSLALSELHAVRRAVAIAEGNLDAAVPFRIGTDADRVRALHHRLGDDIEDVRSLVDEIRTQRALIGGVEFESKTPPSRGVLHAERSRFPVVRRPDEPRLSFVVDATGYSSRSSPDRGRVQERIKKIVDRVLDELRVDYADTDPPQLGGDGLKLALPAGSRLQADAPALLEAMSRAVRDDNTVYRDPLQVRAAATFAMYGVGDLGSTGQSFVELERLVGSKVLKGIVRDDAGLDLAFLVSNSLYDLVFSEQYVSLQFVKHRVIARNYDKTAWLWKR